MPARLLIPCSPRPRRRARQPQRLPALVPVGPLDHVCTQIACLAEDLAVEARRTESKRFVAAASCALDAAVALHKLDGALHLLFDHALGDADDHQQEAAA
jgi:hypothetical protein